MLNEPLPSLSSFHEAHINPHRLLSSCFADMHDEWIRQIRRSVLPRCKRGWSYMLWISRTQANAKRTGTTLAAGPSLPQQGASCTLILSLCRVAHPNEFDHGIGKRKTT